MTTKSRKSSAGKGGNAKPQAQNQLKNAEKPAFVSRYIGIDSHLTERNGSTEQVDGIAVERPAGRKLADDIAKACNQLDAEDYDIIAIFPLTSGRVAEVSVEVAEEDASENVRAGASHIVNILAETPYTGGTATPPKSEQYIDTGVGYSVTDGVIITAKLRE